jgi:hypothetical protein
MNPNPEAAEDLRAFITAVPAKAPRLKAELFSKTKVFSIRGSKRSTLAFAQGSIVRLIGGGCPPMRRPGMRFVANPGPLQIETPFAIPDTTQASFRDEFTQDCHADFRLCALRSSY